MLHYFVLAVKSAFKERKRDALSLVSAHFYTVSSSLWIKSCSVTRKIKATEQFFPVVMFITLYKLVLTFEIADEILWYDDP